MWIFCVFIKWNSILVHRNDILLVNLMLLNKCELRAQENVYVCLLFFVYFPRSIFIGVTLDFIPCAHVRWYFRQTFLGKPLARSWTHLKTVIMLDIVQCVHYTCIYALRKSVRTSGPKCELGTNRIWSIRPLASTELIEYMFFLSSVHQRILLTSSPMDYFPFEGSHFVLFYRQTLAGLE